MIDKYNKIFGRAGEEAAAEYLKKKKYKILERNYKSSYGEIDIIAKFKKDIVFVEVKTRKSDKYGRPYEAVNYYKQKRMIATAKTYLYINDLYDKNVHFDVVEVYGTMTETGFELDEIIHIENAVEQVNQF